MNFDKVAVLRFSEVWLDNYGNMVVFKGLKGHAAAKIMWDHGDIVTQGIERHKVELSLRFATVHGKTYQDWTSDFKKRYPERDVIFDEIQVTTRDHVKLWQMPKVTDALLDKSLAGDEDKFNSFRERYMVSVAPGMAKEVRDKASRLESISRLRKRVMGN